MVSFAYFPLPPIEQVAVASVHTLQVTDLLW